ncbi:MAG: cyanase [Cytophagales bacterium]|nr:cyanase [Armatimonadota bacterium]
MTRHEATAQIIAAQQAKGIKWTEIAARVGHSPAWTTAALLGQHAMSAPEAAAATEALGLGPEVALALQSFPMRGSLEDPVPTDATIYRFYELIQVYGPTIKALIHEEFGDGIMSAIDFSMDIERVPDPKGDRVKVTLNGKFLEYKKF